ncbi:MAG: VWA domain-containing protein [Acidobacteria bacterium]|nr:VWA domain-containing protein [Acidobacteriota bacterium]
MWGFRGSEDCRLGETKWLPKLMMVLLVMAFSALRTSGHIQSGRVQSEPKPKLPPGKTVPIREPSSRPIEPPVRPPAAPTSPSTEDTIRISSDLVTVVATISTNSTIDPPVLDLTDFEIEEDGVRQEIINFARDSSKPVHLAILMDTSLSVAQKLDFEKKAMLRFLERVLRPQDRAALFTVSTEVTLLQDFTAQLNLLSQSARMMRAAGATSLYDGVFLAAEHLRPFDGRKVIVIVSDGSDTTSQKGLLAALERAQQADVMIYAVYTGNFGISQNLRDLAGERALEALTAETGGELLRPRVTPGSQSSEVDELSLSELDRSFASLATQLRTQYILGFYSSNELRDGSFRRLTVTLKQPGLLPRARRGYFAPKS